MRKLVLLVVLMTFVCLGAAHADSTTADSAPSPNLEEQIFAQEPSCKSDGGQAAPTQASVAPVPPLYHYYGYCYYDCSPCWSGNNGADCPVIRSCTEVPLC